MSLFEFTRRLIDISSVSGDEARIADFLGDYLQVQGYHVERQKVEAAERVNLLVTTSKPPRIVFSTHIDTVPPFIASSEDEEFIYGRGACDTKGITAAMLAACENLKQKGEHRFGLLFVVGEETDSIGAQTANKHLRASECLYLINGEPTENNLAVGSKGSLRVRLKTVGKAAHSAYPEQGESAIEKLLDVLNDVRKTTWVKDDFFGDTTCNIGMISGGVRPNVIPAEASADLQIRLVCDSQIILEQLESIVGGRGRVEFLGVTEPVRLHAVEGFKQQVVRFTTDVPHLANWGKPLLLGPGSILDAHTSGEKISKRELLEAVNLYTNLALQLLREVDDAREVDKTSEVDDINGVEA